MSDHFHDPREYIRSVHQILISDKKRVGFLFGAGSSFATGSSKISIPTVDLMTEAIVKEVGAVSGGYANAVGEIRAELSASGASFNIESLLSSIEGKRGAIGKGKLNGLDLKGFQELTVAIKKRIVDMASVHSRMDDAEREKLAHVKIAGWIANARRRFPVEIFTTNYDYLLEIGLESVGVQYFDGFSGAYEPFFCPEAVEDLEAYRWLTKLWKMHGSLGWVLRLRDRSVVRDRVASADAVLVYPSHLKYDTSKKQPYVGLIDRLCSFLQQDDAVLFTCGYSFSDNHINERIATSLRRGGTSHVLALYFDESRPGGVRSYALADETNALRQIATRHSWGRLSVYGVRHAVIGGRFGEWRLRTEPEATDAATISRYFDEDAATPSEEPGERLGDESWCGSGRFLLPDFREFARFLVELSPSEAARG